MDKPHILAVEDDGIIAMRIQDTLKAAGYTVTVTDTGEDAVRQAQEIKPDLVLMDIRLKGDMDGIEAAGIIRSHADIPVIYLTAFSDDTFLQRARQTSAYGYLLKPFRARELIAAVEMAVYRHLLDIRQRDTEARLQYIQKMKSLGTMAGSVAHHFNNILMIIVGYAEMLLDEGKPGIHVKSSYVQEILKICEKAKKLTDHMIVYTGHLHAKQEFLQLTELIRDAAPILEISLSQGKKICYELPEGIETIFAEPGQITQILVNLVENASEAIEKENGIITVSVGVTHADRAELCESWLDDDLPEGRYVFLDVADRGCGMDENTKRQIFDPFFTTKFFGRGLGLAAVLGIVKKYRWAIKVFTEPGAGTRVRILFPVINSIPDCRERADSST